MAKFQDLVAQNPELQQQYQQWKQQQQSQPTPGNQGQGQGQGRANQPDWNAFRQYLKQQGKQDPGEEPEDLEVIHHSA
jgi:hypothetical protein